MRDGVFNSHDECWQQDKEASHRLPRRCDRKRGVYSQRIFRTGMLVRYHSIAAPGRKGTFAVIALVTAALFTMLEMFGIASLPAVATEPGDGLCPGYKDCNGKLGVPYEAFFRKAARTHGVPLPLLVAVAHQESSFRPEVRSAAGAVGVMQLMPEVARELGLVVNKKRDDRKNPERAILAGARFLRQLLDLNEWQLAGSLASYHSGPVYVALWGGVPPPSGDYVRSVLALRDRYAQKGNCH